MFSGLGRREGARRFVAARRDEPRAQVLPMSTDHKPNRPDERERIRLGADGAPRRRVTRAHRRAGGFVSHVGVWRVAGVLAVSRCAETRASLWIRGG